MIIYLSFATAVNNFALFGMHYFNTLLPLLLLSNISGSKCEFSNITNEIYEHHLSKIPNYKAYFN